ncbi:MAG: DUF2334 domain-containing protein [Dehalococcoidia bacterium]|nr:DUF2334 domain-containing protein [Dehalococcoidia bacterium]MDD5495093.1 DUF2334 domain-containing protein [Dehalococcoidia bacterium]
MPAANTNSDTSPVDKSHIRSMETPPYDASRWAIIFTMDQAGDTKLKSVADKIIRVFAENFVPLDVAVAPPANDNEQQSIKYLTDYIDAGIIDISIDGHDVLWLDVDTPDTATSSAELRSQLSLAGKRLKYSFGMTPAACIFPYESLNEYNYGILQSAGYKIIGTQNPPDFPPSRQPVNWSGKADPNGLYRFPIVGTVNYPTSSTVDVPASRKLDVNKAILSDAAKALNDTGTAVIEIRPEYFLDNTNKADTIKLQQLNDLIKSCKKLGEITTFYGWYRYATKYIEITPVKQRVLPVYNGGWAVVFRLDDVTKGWYEETVQEIIRLFQKNGVPLDCGVISNVNGTDSYEIPWLKDYFDEGAVGISIHGYDWTYYQLDTTKSGLTYDFIKLKLVRARDQYLQYYGVSPVALTVPTDFYDETGYRAVDEAGFKIFATQIATDLHPSNVPVDYFGHKDPKGMYRIPTSTDVCEWDPVIKNWGDLYDISKIASTKDFCKYYQALSVAVPSDIFGYSLCSLLSELGVAAISIHPDAFIDKDRKPDYAKLQKLDTMLKWVKTFATITTFEQWYNYASKNN